MRFAELIIVSCLLKNYSRWREFRGHYTLVLCFETAIEDYSFVFFRHVTVSVKGCVACGLIFYELHDFRKNGLYFR